MHIVVYSESVPSENMFWISTCDTTAKTFSIIWFDHAYYCSSFLNSIITKHLAPMIISIKNFESGSNRTSSLLFTLAILTCISTSELAGRVDPFTVIA